MTNLKFKSKRVFPRNIGDIMSFGFLVIIIPLVFWFESSIVIPALYPAFGFWYVYHIFVAIFLLFQIVSNFIYIILVDSSIYSVTLPAELREGWWFCAPCESVAPPRSYHCHMCDVCILKRDHHCRFSACCIGHYNHRFFMLFLFYLTVATIYATYFNLFFILNYINFNWGLLLKIVFPLAFLVFGLDTSTNHVYLVLFIVVFLGSLVSLLLLIYHLTLIQYGCLTFEKNRKLKGYNFGLKVNIEEVFGTRWHLVWLGPFIESPLPSNGANWDVLMAKHVKCL